MILIYRLAAVETVVFRASGDGATGAAGCRIGRVSVGRAAGWFGRPGWMPSGWAGQNYFFVCQEPSSLL